MNESKPSGTGLLAVNLITLGRAPPATAIALSTATVYGHPEAASPCERKVPPCDKIPHYRYENKQHKTNLRAIGLALSSSETTVSTTATNAALTGTEFSEALNVHMYGTYITPQYHPGSG
jgi:hypothetical protein